MKPAASLSALALWVAAAHASLTVPHGLAGGAEPVEQPDRVIVSIASDGHVQHDAALSQTAPGAEAALHAARASQRAHTLARSEAEALAVAPALQEPGAPRWRPTPTGLALGLLLLATLGYGGARSFGGAPGPVQWERLVQCALACAVGLGYLLTSSAIILTNKYLLHADRFPYPAPLMAFHQSCIWAFASVLYMLVPSIFPAAQAALEDSNSGESKTTKVLARMRPFAPIGLLAAVGLLTSNYAYLYASVSFLQMVKEGNVVWIYLGSLLVGLEKFQWRLAVSLLFVFIGAVGAVNGELHFALLGLVIQLVCCLAESVRVIYMGYLMSGGGVQKVDPLSFVLASAPVTLLMLSPLLVFFWDPHIPSRFMSCLPLVLLSTGLAFALQVLIAVGVKMLSGVGFVLVTILKDVIVVATATSFMGESLSAQQVAGFSVCTAGILAYSLLKQMPQSPVPKANLQEGSAPAAEECRKQ